MNKFFVIIATVIFLFTFTGCKKKQTSVIKQNTIQIDMKVSSQNLQDEKTQTWHATNKKIFVLFGYGFNSDEFMESATKTISETFGLFENGGEIIPVYFPKNFRHGERGVTSDFYNMISEDEGNIIGLLTFGSPENIYRALAMVQDEWNGALPFPVFSFFPQDDVLGTEDTSDIVIDKIQELEEEVGEFEGAEIKWIQDLLVMALRYIHCLDSGIEKNETLFTHAKQLLPGQTVTRYIDSDTGLYSINHFIIQR